MILGMHDLSKKDGLMVDGRMKGKKNPYERLFSEKNQTIRIVGLSKKRTLCSTFLSESER